MTLICEFIIADISPNFRFNSFFTVQLSYSSGYANRLDNYIWL